ncbi:hypothetical protein ACFLTP_06305 [Chloroflexota bacterium]
MNNTVYVVILIAVLFLGAFVFPQLMVKRAIPLVIEIFRNSNTVGITGAKTLNDLGLGARTLVEKMWKTRDCKSRALQVLVNSNIIQTAEDGRFYLSEENILVTKWRAN